MSETNSTPPSAPEAVSTSTPSPWLEYLEQSIKEEKEDYFGDARPFEIVRDLLLAPAEDGNATTTAVQRFHESYIGRFSGESLGNSKPPEYGAGNFLNSIAMAVFETAHHLLFTDPRHDRLADVLIAIKESAASKFDPEDPKFVYYGWGLEAAAAENWNGSVPFSGTKDDEYGTVAQKANTWLSIAALLAKLFRSGLLPEDGPHWITGDFNYAFEEHTKGDIATNVGRQAQVLGPANHILIAGEELAREVKTPSRERRFELSEEKWRSWAEKMKEMADAAPEDAQWDLKGRTQAAYDKMVELLPEAFETT